MSSPNFLSSRTVQISLFGAVILVAGWYGLVRPESQRLTLDKKERDDLITQSLNSSEKQKLLSQAELRYTSLQSDLDRLNNVVPEASETGTFVNSLNDAASQAGVNIVSIATKVVPKTAPQAPTTGKNSSTPAAPAAQTVEQELLKSFNATTVDLRASGSYQSIRTFIQTIRQMERFVSISSLILTQETSPGGITSKTSTLSASITMTIFHRQAAK